MPAHPALARLASVALALVVAAVAGADARAQDAVGPAPAPAPPVAPGPAPSAWVRDLRDVAVPMRDGATLAANVRLPEAPGRYPAIVVQTPYDKDRMGREVGDAAAGGEAARGSAAAWARFDRAHYAYVFVDWRGFHASRAAQATVDRRKWRRGQDGYDVVEWAAAQPWCDGKVGTWGGSALGKQQLDTAAERPPHLVCAVPLIAFMGQRAEGYFEGGVPLEAHTRALDALGFGVGTWVEANPFPTSPAWALARRLTDRPERIDVPCLFVSGWFDLFPREVIETFEAVVARGGERARAGSKLVMGPWAHTAVDLAAQGELSFPAAEGVSTALTLRFFDHHLRGLDVGWDAEPRVRLFQTGEERWVTGESVAALAGTPVPWTLTADGGLVRADGAGPVATGGRPSRVLRDDPSVPTPTRGGRNLPPLAFGPRDQASPTGAADELAFGSAPLAAPWAARGDVTLSLVLLCDRPDADVVARLCDGFPDGRSMLVAETAVRASLRDGRTRRLLAPGEPVRVTLRFPPTAWTWPAGHRIVLRLSGSSAPRYERNPHTGAARWDGTKAVPATIEVLLGPDAASLRLPGGGEVPSPGAGGDPAR
ncbi:MAG: CocE/NonD family hydrolase [Planctomycetes bacterium]|nr:CocE/NonD family hydrolase [Planctomycetota bacterium]